MNIEKALEEHWKGKKVVKCVVATRDEWKGVTDHPYRTNPSLGLVGIPTVIVLQKDAQLLKVDDEEGLSNESDLEELLTTYQ